MKGIFLAIAILLSVSGMSQILTPTSITNQISTTNASGFGVNSATFTAGRLYLLIAITTGTTNNGSITSTSTTWTNVLDVGDATRRLQIFRFAPATTVTGENVSIGTFGGGSTGYYFNILEISGAKVTGTNGSDAIRQTVSASATTSSNPSLVFPGALGSDNNTVLAVFGNSANPFGGTPESGFVEYFESGYSTPTSGVYVMYNIGGEDGSPIVTAASSTWIGAALEIVPARRVLSAN